MEQTFRTLEKSNPRYGFKNLQFVTVKSTHLKGRGDICFYKPEKCPADTPVVILLHGVYGSAWSWPLCSGVHEQAERAILAGQLAPMILAMPSDGLWGDGSGYVPHRDQDFEQWIVQDVPQAAREAYPDAVSAESRFFIAGLSMGGYGALRIGSSYPHIFSAFAGLSSITTIDEFSLFVEEELSAYRWAAPHDLLASFLANKEKLRPFRFDCGRGDLLLKFNRKLHSDLEEAGIYHTYREYTGEHNWDYWKNNILETLLFFNLQL